MPGPPPTPVHSDKTLPARVDVAVIGGGIIGTSAALELAEKGHSVALFEKGEIAGEQSGRNWGWVRVALRDPRELELMFEALRLWEGFETRLENPTGFTKCGILFAYGDEKTRAAHENWAKNLAPFQMHHDMIDAARLRELTSDHVTADGALYTPFDARAEPQLAAPAVAEGARARGAGVFTGCAVRGIETTGGRVSAIVTERGAVACDAVILAGGAWSRLFAGNMGIDIPQLKVLNTVLRTTPAPEDAPTTCYWDDGVSWRRRADGGFTVADGGSNQHGITPDSVRQFFRFLPALKASATSVTPRFDDRFLTELRWKRRWPLDKQTEFERSRILDPTPSARRVNAFWRKAQAQLPALKDTEIAQVWGGLIDVTPDVIPIISNVDTLPGLTIATGFSGHGFGIGPGAGALAADLATGRPPRVETNAFRLSRFFDGSPIQLGGGV